MNNHPLVSSEGALTHMDCHWLRDAHAGRDERRANMTALMAFLTAALPPMPPFVARERTVLDGFWCQQKLCYVIRQLRGREPLSAAGYAEDGPTSLLTLPSIATIARSSNFHTAISRDHCFSLLSAAQLLCYRTGLMRLLCQEQSKTFQFKKKTMLGCSPEQAGYPPWSA